MDYKSVIESRYNREAWEALLHDIFLNGANFRTTPIPVDAHSPLVAESLQLGTITLKDDNKIAVYEIKLSDRVDIVENRVGIRNLLFSDWKLKGCAGAFIFCYRDNESVLRFSYVSQTFAFGEDGKMTKEETDTKRFTYILGEGHRSRTAIGQFENLKSSTQTLKDLTKAFSLDAVSDKFFDDYKEIYEDIVEYVTGKRYVKVANKWEEKVIHAPNELLMGEFSWYEDPEKTVRDYVKRLMSRIVFLQFIQKKGWLGVPVDKEWGEGDKEFLQHLYEKYENKDNFIDGILELLFEDINRKRENDLANFMLGRDIKVPYLNGGLFERDTVDERTFRLPRKLMDKMMNFFSSYNFTIDENDPDDAEIGVDPEMLGRIFENLLEDNKDKGAFYTPKEIVQYMCQESLIAYLQKGKSDADAETIRTFVATYDVSALSENLKFDVDTKLKTVKICDPAIGSGAFPMGLLKELFACRSAIEGLSEDNAAEIKKHIIQNNIYGVDIEKGAVEIARLRFWLAIVVDEKTPQALPNMDFKIMQGNSLMPTFNNKFIDFNDDKRHVNSSVIRENKKKLFSLQNRFFSAQSNEKDDLLVQIKHTILEIVKLQMDFEYRFEVQNSAHTLNLFDTNENDNIVDTNKSEIIEECAKIQRTLADDRLPLSERAKIETPFFDWKIMFPDIFGLSNDGQNHGFDIVIGNPPYGANIDDLTKLYESLYPTTSHGDKDIYKYFYDRGKDLCGDNSVLCYITPNTYLRQPRYADLRRLLLNYSLKQVIDLGEKIFVDAVVPVAITILQTQKQNATVLFADLTKTITIENAYSCLHPVELSSINQSTWETTPNNIFVEETHSLSEDEIPLDEILDMRDCGFKYQRHNVGLSQKGKNDLPERIFYKGSYLEDSRDIPILIGKEINAFVYSRTPAKRLRYNFQSLLKSNESTYYNQEIMEAPIKLIWRQTAPYFIGTVLSEKIFFGNTIQAGVLRPKYKDTFSYEYLCGLLNSNHLREIYEKNVKESGRVFPQVKLEKLRPLPIKILSRSEQRPIEDLVDRIIKQKEANIDTSSLEQQLNTIVNKIYSKA